MSKISTFEDLFEDVEGLAKPRDRAILPGVSSAPKAKEMAKAKARTQVAKVKEECCHHGGISRMLARMLVVILASLLP